LFDATLRLLKEIGSKGIVLIAMSTAVFAQWVPHGPSPITVGQVEGITDGEVVGAIHTVAAHPTDANIVYVGAVNGGIWRTDNATAAKPTWVNQTEFQPSLSIGAIEFDPTDTTNQTLVAGLGRRSSFGSFSGGGELGILRTTDGGTTWVSLGSAALLGFTITGVAPRGSTIIISVKSSIAANQGIWRSTDTGVTWTRISGTAGTGLLTGDSFDLSSDPNDQTRLFTNAGINGIFRSTDTGATWAKVSDATMDALMTNAQRNIEIVVGTSNNVYVAIVNPLTLAGLFRSGDGGTTWTSLDLPLTTENAGATFGIHPGDQGRNHLSMAADPANASILYIGGDRQPCFTESNACNLMGTPRFPNSLNANNFTGRLFRVDASQPAGSQAAAITHVNTASNSSPHADSRDMDFSSNGDLIEVDDGGIYRRTTPQTNTGDWFSMNGNLQVTELHDLAWDAKSKIIIGGTQDTGTPEQILPTNVSWRSVARGDGGDMAVDDISTPGSSVRYSSADSLQGFRRRVVNSANVEQSNLTFTTPLSVLSGGNPIQAQFVTPVEINKVNGNRLILGGNNSVYESIDQGDNYTEIGVGIRINATAGEPVAYGATGNEDILYVGSNNRVFVRTAAPPAALTQSTTYTGGIVSDIVIDPDDSQTAFVSDNDSVFFTTNAGTSWTDITGNLTTFNSANLWSIAFSTSNADGSVIVGGDTGVFIAPGPAFNNWSRLGTNLPSAPVYDLEYDPADEILVAATMGRGAWSINLAERDPVDVMLVLDTSGSMAARSCGTCSPKLTVLKDAVEIFIQLWTSLAVTDDRLGVSYFNTNIDDFDPGGVVLLPVLANAAAMITDVKAQNAQNLTAMGGGIQSSVNRLTDTARPRNIILFTDGMQNVNPMVVEPELDIENEPDRTDSNIPPLDPPTRLDSNLDIKVNTIGVGATPPFVDLLDNIATETGGLSKLTTAPDEELRRFYVEELIDALRQFSPQLLDYRYGTHSTQETTESFTSNNGVNKIILKLSWNRPAKLSFSVEKDGVNVTRAGRIIDGPHYRIFSMDLPAQVFGTPINAGGEWKMIIRGDSNAPYEAAAIVEEPQLDYEFSLGGKDYVAGQPLELKVRLGYGGLPLTDANRVTARILKPNQGLGTLLSVTPMPSEPAGFLTETAATVAQKKLQLLVMDEQFYRELRPVPNTVTLQNNGDGTYTATFPNTNVEGTYSVIFQVDGERTDIGKYQRTEILSTMVRFSKADFNVSDLRVTFVEETAAGRSLLLHIRPKDRFGNFLGPDYGHRINATLSVGSVGTDRTDLVDGSYTIPLLVPDGEDPILTVSVMDERVYEGPLSDLKKGTRFAVSVHLGVALPLSDFNDFFDPGFLLEGDFEYRFSPRLSIEGVLGRYAFDSDFDIIGGTLYLKGSVPLNTFRIFGALGPGVYKPESEDAAFGISFGGGLNIPVTQQIDADLGAYYFHIFSENGDIDFLGLKAGLRFSF
jgi:photosystem II stability/assembly factor-like uncharacterized protein